MTESLYNTEVDSVCVFTSKRPLLAVMRSYLQYTYELS